MFITTKKAAAACCGLMLLAGCASQKSGQEIVVNTVPPQARCEITRGGLTLGHIESTPGAATVSLDRDNITIECRKKGFFKTIFLNKAQVIGSSGMGFAADAITGVKTRYTSPVTINLLKEPSAY